MQDVVLAPAEGAGGDGAPSGGRPARSRPTAFLGRVFDVPLINLGVSVGRRLCRAQSARRRGLAGAISLKTVDEAITSMAAHALNASPDTELLAAEIWGSWSENVVSWTTDPPPLIKVVRYEDLIADPITGIHRRRRAHAYRRHAGRDRGSRRASSFERVCREEEDAGGFAERPEWVDRFFRVGRAGQWHDRLTPEQVERIVADHGEQMRRFGYLPT